MSEPELISIIEGPTPDFRLTPYVWSQSVLEGPVGSQVALCELRTYNGDSIISRCTEAWREGRPVRLDFPDEIRMRQQLDVVAMRLRALPEGVVLMLWVQQPYDAHDLPLDEEEDEELFDPELDDDDDEDADDVIDSDEDWYHF